MKENKQLLFQKALAILLAASLILSNFTLYDRGTYAYAEAETEAGAWDGTATEVDEMELDGDTYLINSPADLAGFAKIVNTQDPSANGRLCADLDMSEGTWIPIGNEGEYYSGTFEGDGHSVTLSVPEEAGVTYGGLFAQADGANIKGVVIKGEIYAQDYAGGIVGYGENVTITECRNEAEIHGSTAAGGLIGYGSGNILRCANKGSISGDGYAAGGILGVACGDTSIESSYNQGSITSEYYAAGILGYGESGPIEMNSVYSSATIEGSSFGGIDFTGIISGADVGEILTGNEEVGGENIFGYFQKKQLDPDYQSLIENYQSFQELSDMAGLVDALNSGEDIFLVQAGGWPILKWENSSEVSPEELQAKIEAAKAEINGIGEGEDYDTICRNKFTELKEAALTNLGAATTLNEVERILGKAKADLTDIPTKGDKNQRKDALLTYSEADYEEAAWEIITEKKEAFIEIVDASVSKTEMDTRWASVETELKDVITTNEKRDLLKALDTAYGKYKEEDYAPEKWTELETAYRQARTAIEKETGKTKAVAAKNNAVAAMKEIRTILSDLRETKKAEFTKYFTENYKKEDYSTEKWKQITNPNSGMTNKGYYNNALTAIAKATEEQEIDNIIEKAKADMAKVYTLVQEAELASLKAKLKAELDSRLAGVDASIYEKNDYDAMKRSVASQKNNIDGAYSFEQAEEYYGHGLKAIQNTITTVQREEQLARIEEVYQRCLQNKANYDDEDWKTIETNYQKKSELNSTSDFTYAKQWADRYIRAMNNVLTKEEKVNFEAGRSEVLAMLQGEYEKYLAKKGDYDQNCGEDEEGWRKLEKINKEAVVAIQKVKKDEGKSAMTAIYEQAAADMAAVTSLTACRENLAKEIKILTKARIDAGLYTEKGKMQLQKIQDQTVAKMTEAASVKAIQSCYDSGVNALENVIESAQEEALNAAISAAVSAFESYFSTKYPEANKDKYEAADWQKLQEIYRETIKKMKEVYTKDYTEQLEALRRNGEASMGEISIKGVKIAKLVIECMKQIEGSYALHNAILDFASENLMETFSSFAYDLWCNGGDGLKAGIQAAKEKIKDIFEKAKATLEGSDSSSEVTARMNEILAQMDSAEKSALTIENTVTAADKWDGYSKTEPQAGDGSAENPYQIGTAAQLAWFAEEVNKDTIGSKPGSSLCAVLTKDIDLAGYDWTPIAMTDDLNGRGYLGTFDGKGYTLHNLKVDTTGLSGTLYRGLFGTLGKEGTIRNLHVAGNLYFVKQGEAGITGSSGFGGIVGNIKSGTVYNCISSVKIKRDTYTAASYIGGIAGRMDGGIIDRCRSYAFFVDATSSSYSNTGGIVGRMNGNGASYSMVRYCVYDGSFATAGTGIGGIAGCLEQNAIVRECINRAPIGKLRTTAGSSYTGGIVGLMDNNSKVLYVYNSGEINGGSIHAGDNASDGTGGIVGGEGRSTAKGEEKSLPLISHAYNSGTVTAELRAGGIVGRVTKGTVSNAESCAEGRMFGYVENAGTNIENAVSTEQVNFTSTGEGNSEELALAKLTNTRRLVAKYKAEEDAVYGQQTKVYNDLIDTYIRKVEEAATAEEAQQATEEGEAALAKVNTQLAAAKEAAKTRLRSYVAARVYDSKKAEDAEKSVAEQIVELLEEALAKAENADSLTGVNNVLMEYLGTEDTAGRFDYFETYNTQTVKGLYSDFLYNKAYDAKDLATLQTAYEVWAEKILQADSEKRINELAAEAKKELTELSKGMTLREPGESAALPAYEKDDSDALNEAKAEIYQEIAAKYDWKDYGDEEWKQICSEFEKLRLALKQAETIDDANTIAASSKAILEEVKTLEEQALEAAQKEAETTLKDKIEELIQKLRSFFGTKTTEVGEEKIQSSQLKEALDRANSDGEEAIRKEGENVSFAQKALKEIRKTLQDAINRAEEAYGEAEKKLSALFERISSAGENAWDGVTLSAPDTGDGSAENPYQITTGAELAWFSALVNGKLTGKDSQNSNGSYAQGILMNDIDLAYKPWTPIGSKDEENNGIFRGVFDGKGHRISGMYVKAEVNRADTAEYYGLFGYIVGGTVKNLTVEGEISAAIGKKDRVGGIVGYLSSGNIENCTSEVNPEVKFESNDAKGCGGIAGEAVSGRISDCVNRGSIKTSGTTCANALGGIAGLHESGAIDILRCANLGSIDAYKAKGTGGILGYATKTFSVKECANLADITIEVITDGYGAGGTGGIVGVANLYNEGALIQNVYNIGRIKAESMAGGIIGGESATYQKNGSDNQPTESIGSGSDGLVLANCYNAGTIAGPNAQVSNKMAAIAGLPINGTYMTKIYMLEGSAKSAMGYISTKGNRITTISDGELKEVNPKEIFTENSNGIQSIADINKGYPIFSWQLLHRENRRQIKDYLQNYYETLIKPIASQKQKEQIEALLAEKYANIEESMDAEAIRTAYNEALLGMNVDALLEGVKEEAKTTIMGIDADSYPESVRKQIKDFIEGKQKEIDKAENAKAIDEIVNGTYAGIVDILITEIENPEFKPALATAAEANTYKEKINTAKGAYDKLTESQKSMVQNYIKISQAEAKYQEYQNRSEAKAVDDKIAAIGKVTKNSSSKIKEARNAYNALSAAAKKYVRLLSVLEKAEADYKKLAVEANLDRAEDVIKLIDDIRKVTLDSYDKIMKATKAYNALTRTQAAAVPAAKVEILKAAMLKYNALLEAATTGIVTVDIKADAEGKTPATEENKKTLLDAMDTLLQVGANTLLLDIGDREYTEAEIRKLLEEVDAFKELLEKGMKVRLKTASGEIALYGVEESKEPEEKNNEEKEKAAGTKISGSKVSSSKPFAPATLKWTGQGTSGRKGVSVSKTVAESTGKMPADEAVVITKENPISNETRPFDLSIILMIMGIAVAVAIGGGLIKWFAVAKHNRRK